MGKSSWLCIIGAAAAAAASAAALSRQGILYEGLVAWIIPLAGAALLAASLAEIVHVWPLITAQWRRFRYHGKAAPPLPPGSMGWPYWGETLPYMADPDAWYAAQQARHGGSALFRSSLLGSPTVVMLAPEAHEFVLRNENRLFESSWPRSLRELEGSHAVSMVVGPAHARLRRAIHSFLNADTLRAFTRRIDGIVLAHLLGPQWPTGETIRAFPALQKLAFELNAELFMGLKPGPELDELHKHYEDFTAGLGSQPLDLPWTVFGKAKRARGVLLKFMFRKVESRREELMMGSLTSQEMQKQLQYSDDGAGKNGRESFLDLLLMSKEEETGELYSVEEIAENMLLMVHAGQDTTATALAVTLKHLSTSPIILAQLRSECKALAASKTAIDRDDLKSLRLLRCVISEGLRLCPPVSALFKQAKDDIHFKGYTIPKGWKVHLALRYTHLGEQYFPDPSKFDPSRFEKRKGGFAYLPFGQGARICPGIEFAKITMELFFFHFVTMFEWELVDPHEKIVVQTFAPYPERGLPIKLISKI